MIEARELFVGAKVLAFKGMVCEVEEIRSKTVFFKEGATGVKFEDLNPIPLTEEWLLRAGFERNWEYTSVVYEKSCMQLEWNGYHWTDGNDGFIVGVKYVHQLQNLYYCLVGEELIFKA
ncbi:hypothetical protein [Rufibacter quisquiliarum]|uniref:Uncharacterized protein n=1 Tax=Rufibacter quisquiliarum TaxID=1549639 RepID=A0A839GFC1_9BACT|nr:hypothetical protein [Rufibacter quisquiliarum]MBA9078334.1 hypothetical protein [Rufibacter quisquiliarum]